MRCQLEFTGRKDSERFIHKCTVCGKEYKSRNSTPTLKANCKAATEAAALAVRLPLPPPHGPGTEFVGLTNYAGLRSRGGCNCKALQAEMDRAGVAGCREKREYFVARLKENAKQFYWLETITAGVKLVSEPWFNPLDPLGSMFDEAISRAAAQPRPPIRVAFLSPSLLLGGAERWIASLCRHFDPAKVWPQAVALVEYKHRSPVVEAWLPKHIKVVSAEVLPSIFNQVDVLISWGTADLANRTKGAKCQIVEVQHGTMGFGEVQRKLALAGIAAGAHLASVGEACLDNYPTEYRSKVAVIQNGAETDRLQPIEGREATRAKLGIQPGEKICLYVGRIAAVKNLAGLAAAVKLLPDWRLIVAGPSYYEVDLGERTIVLPAQEQLGDLFAAADVFCAPSHHEANSLAVMEAMLAGVPVVTTDYPAALELQKKHGKMSELVPVNPAPEVLAAAIVKAEKMPHVQQIALEHYTAEAMTRRWESYLLEIARVPA